MAVVALLASGSAADIDFSDVCHCMQSPNALMDILDRQQIQHGLRNGPIAEMFPDLSEAEFSLLKEYWDQCDVLRRYYSNLQMTGSGVQRFFLRTSDGEQATQTRTTTFAYYAAGETQFRLDLHRKDEKSGNKIDTIGVITPSSQSLLRLDEKTRQWFLIGHGNHLPRALFEFCLYSPHHRAYTGPDATPIYQELLFDFTASLPGVQRGRIVQVTPLTDDDGEDIVQVLWKSNQSETHQKIAEFLRRRAWAVKSFVEEGISPPQEAAPHGYAFRDIVRCTYSYGVDGMPLLKSHIAEKWFADAPDLTQLKLQSRREVVVAQCIPGAAPPEVFDVDALLGKKRSVTPQSPPTNWVWLLVNGFLLFILGIYSLRRSHKRSPSTPAPPLKPE